MPKPILITKHQKSLPDPIQECVRNQDFTLIPAICPYLGHRSRTLDEDSTLINRSPAKKGKAIAEKDTDGTYVLTEGDLEVSSNVKM